jgi:hypothetical protein
MFKVWQDAFNLERLIENRKEKAQLRSISMNTRTELALVCRRLENELLQAGFAFGDLQFDETEQTLYIVVDLEADWQVSRKPPAGFAGGAAIDARILWDLLRDLVKLGVTNPAIQLQPRNSYRRVASQTWRDDDAHPA